MVLQHHLLDQEETHYCSTIPVWYNGPCRHTGNFEATNEMSCSTKRLRHIILTSMFLKLYFSKLVCENIALDDECYYYTYLGYCNHSYKEWMAINCRKTCNLCQGKSSNVDSVDQ